MRSLRGSQCDKVGEATLVFSGLLFRGKNLNDAPPPPPSPCQMKRAHAPACAGNKSKLFSAKNATLAGAKFR